MPLTSVKGVGRGMKDVLFPAVGKGDGNSLFRSLYPQPQVAVCWIKAWARKDRE